MIIVLSNLRNTNIKHLQTVLRYLGVVTFWLLSFSLMLENLWSFICTRKLSLVEIDLVFVIETAVGLFRAHQRHCTWPSPIDWSLLVSMLK